jgi:hypothetical protein
MRDAEPDAFRTRGDKRYLSGDAQIHPSMVVGVPD